MLRSKALLSVLGLLLAGSLPAEVSGLPGASNNPYMNRHVKEQKLDPDVMRGRVEESEGLFDALARETRSLDSKRVDALFTSLRDEYHLGDFVGKAHRSLEQAEAVLTVQDAVKAQEARLSDPFLPEAKKEEAKLASLKADLQDAQDSLHETLRGVHSNADEDVNRDLHNWLMISEGLLRGQREEAAAKALSGTAAAGSPGAEPLSAVGLSPSAATPGKP